jgi:hypothetical protein
MMKRMREVALAVYGEGEPHPLLARALLGLADMRLKDGDYADADALCRRGLAIMRKVFFQFLFIYLLHSACCPANQLINHSIANRPPCVIARFPLVCDALLCCAGSERA